MLTFKNLVIFFLTQLQRSITRELLDFIESLKEHKADLSSVSAAAFCKARKKLNYTVFKALNEHFINGYYEKSATLKVWKDFRLLAVDGSTIEVPNSKELIEKWGVFKTRQDGKKICMARILEVFDVLNKMTIESEIDSINISEIDMFWQLSPNLSKFPSLDGVNDLYIFDRYYASFELIFFLNKMGKDYCFRMKENWWDVIKKFKETGKESQIITLHFPKYPKGKREELAIEKESVPVRLVRVELDNGVIEYLLTSLLDEKEVTVSDIKELYSLRWPIETNYRHQKHKLKLENFSGKSENAVRQDFFAKILLLNIAVSINNPLDNKLLEEQTTKYTYQVNLTNTIGVLKASIIDWFMHRKIKESLNRIIKYLLRSALPIRPGRKYTRPKLTKTKYHRIYAQV